LTACEREGQCLAVRFDFSPNAKGEELLAAEKQGGSNRTAPQDLHGGKGVFQQSSEQAGAKLKEISLGQSAKNAERRSMVGEGRNTRVALTGANIWGQGIEGYSLTAGERAGSLPKGRANVGKASHKHYHTLGKWEGRTDPR